jgi:outer membrane protein assembly factor BamB
VDVVCLPDGSILRASDGKDLWRFNHDYYFSEIPWSSPVVSNGAFYQVATFGQWIMRVDLPGAAADALNPKVTKIDSSEHKECATTASPIVHDGLIYTVGVNGLLRVFDAATSKLVYDKQLDFHIKYSYVNEPGVSASLCMAGGKIFITDNQLTTLVIEPGRAFKLVAKNTLENIWNFGRWGEGQEQFLSTPVFDGDRIYFRGFEYLYCIGEK